MFQAKTNRGMESLHGDTQTSIVNPFVARCPCIPWCIPAADKNWPGTSERLARNHDQLHSP
jgi:hypothetical protein